MQTLHKINKLFIRQQILKRNYHGKSCYIDRINYAYALILQLTDYGVHTNAYT